MTSDSEDDISDISEAMAELKALVLDQGAQLCVLRSQYAALADNTLRLASEAAEARSSAEEIREQLCSFEDDSGRVLGELRVVVHQIAGDILQYLQTSREDPKKAVTK